MSEEQLKARLEEIKLLQQVNHDAKSQKIAIEDEIDKDPYTAHLYQEQQYMQLIFLEMRRMNSILEKICQMHTFDCQQPEVHETGIAPTRLSEMMYEHNEGPCVQSGEKPDEDPLPLLHADSGDEPGITPKKPVVKKKVRR